MGTFTLFRLVHHFTVQHSFPTLCSSILHNFLSYLLLFQASSNNQLSINSSKIYTLKQPSPLTNKLSFFLAWPQRQLVNGHHATLFGIRQTFHEKTRINKYAEENSKSVDTSRKKVNTRQQTVYSRHQTSDSNQQTVYNIEKTNQDLVDQGSVPCGNVFQILYI